MRPKVAAMLVLAVLVLIILFQNLHPVRIDFLFWSPMVPLLVLVVVLLGVGFVIGLLTCALRK